MRSRTASRITGSALLLLASQATACGGSSSFALESPSFERGARIPDTAAFDGVGCMGGNHSPQLSIRGVPSDARSLALVLHDPDAPVEGGFDHWVVFDLPPDTTSLPDGVDPMALGAHEGTNDFGRPGYGGPCPPSGPAHRYVFTLYALDVPHLSLGPDATGKALRRAVEGHAIARATLEGTYARTNR